MAGKPRIQALLLQNLMLGPLSTCKLSARSSLRTQECQESPSLQLIETPSPKRLGLRLMRSELYNPSI